MALAPGVSVTRALRRQLAVDVKEVIGQVGEAVESTTLSMIIFEYLILNTAQSALEMVGIINLQTHMTLFNRPLPAELDEYCGYLFTVIAFDYLPTDTLYEQIDDFKYESFLPRFEAYGYESKMTLINIGSVVIF